MFKFIRSLFIKREIIKSKSIKWIDTTYEIYVEKFTNKLSSFFNIYDKNEFELNIVCKKIDMDLNISKEVSYSKKMLTWWNLNKPKYEDLPLTEKLAIRILDEIVTIPSLQLFLEKNNFHDEVIKFDENQIDDYANAYKKVSKIPKDRINSIQKVGTLICEPLSLDDTVLEKFNEDVKEYEKKNQEYERKERKILEELK